MSNEIVRVTDIGDEKLGVLLARSGYFQDARDAGQAVVKVLAGREIGLGPIASMTGIYVINGRVAIGANVMAAALKRTGRYTYRIIEHSDKVCRIDFMERDGAAWAKVGTSEFTIDDARKAGTKNLDKFPRNMLFARAMSNGVRWFAPDVFAGSPAYTPEELGAQVNEDGEVIDAKAVAVESPAREADTVQEQKVVAQAAATKAPDVKAQVEAAMNDIGAKGEDVQRVLGSQRVSEWLAQDGHTIDGLKSLVLDGMTTVGK